MSTPTQALKFTIDTSICSGHGRCYVLAQKSFTADEIGYGQVVERSEPLDNRDAMEAVVISCPEGAISIDIVHG